MSPRISIKALLILAVSILNQADAYSNASQPNSTTPDPITASKYTPPEFIPNYNASFCPSNTTRIKVPPIVTYYPFSTHKVWSIIYDFYNISWINPAIKTWGEGPDNVIGAIRHQEGDPFAKTEILSAYYSGEAPNAQGFFGQMSNYAPDTVDAAPGWTIEKIAPVLTMVPACGGGGGGGGGQNGTAATQLGFYLTYCMGSHRAKQTPGFNETTAAAQFAKMAFQGSAGALANLWKILDAGRGTAFNSTGSCAAVSAYQKKSE